MLRQILGFTRISRITAYDSDLHRNIDKRGPVRAYTTLEDSPVKPSIAVSPPMDT
jgi:hypothetical protein